MIDLKARTNSSYESLAAAVSGTSVGYFFGALIGGLLVDKFGLFCDLMIAVALDGGAAATVVIPWAQRTEVIWVLCSVQGLCSGVLNTGTVRLLTDGQVGFPRILRFSPTNDRLDISEIFLKRPWNRQA